MLEDILSNKLVTFQETNMPVPYNYRMHYRYAQIAVIIGKCCSRNSISWPKLQIISSALNYEEEYKNLIRFLENPQEYIPYIKFEPALGRAINFMYAEGLIKFNSGERIILTDIGINFHKELIENTTVMVSDKEKILSIGKKLTESLIQKIVMSWRLYHV